MEEAGPLKAGLLTAHPEHRGDPYDQHHQVLDEVQGQVGSTSALHLQDAEEEEEDGGHGRVAEVCADWDREEYVSLVNVGGRVGRQRDRRREG